MKLPSGRKSAARTILLPFNALLAQLFCHVELSFDLLIELHNRSRMHWQREGVRRFCALALSCSGSSHTAAAREARDANKV
jgi:hypothetical protein